MAILGQTPIDREYIKLRWNEPYTTHGLNKKNFGVWPDGVYQGFTIGPGGLGPRDIIVGPGSVSGGVSPAVSGVGYLSGNFDATLGYSIAVVNDPQGYSNTIQIPPGPNAIMHLDATGLEGQHLFVVLTATYALNQQTTADILLVDGAYIDEHPWVVVLGNVTIPPSPVNPLDASDFQYADTHYPRKTPLSSPTRSGLMPASAWGILQQNMPWQNLLMVDVDENNFFNITITPSQFTANGKRLYTFIQQNVSSKFPRDINGNYNGGLANTQLTLMNVATGQIGGAHQLPGNGTFPIASVSGTPNAFQAGIISITPDDAINVVYGAISTSVSGAIADQNLPIPYPTFMQIGGFVVSTDSGGQIRPLINPYVSEPILWRRPFLNTGIGNGVQPNFVQERAPALSLSQYALSAQPVNADSLLVMVDGFPVESSIWSLGAQVITFDNDLAPGQTVDAFYIAEGQSMVQGFQEVPAGLVNGVNARFDLSNQVANRASLLVFVDSLKTAAEYDLVQEETVSYILFKPGHEPQIAQTVYAFYLVNVATPTIINGGGGGGGGGGSSAVTPRGTFTSPIVVNPFVGLSVTTDPSQGVFMQSSGGQQTVSANPQIQPGTALFQTLILMGTSDTDYITLTDGNGLALNGPIDLKAHQMISLVWSGFVWVETSRT